MDMSDDDHVHAGILFDSPTRRSTSVGRPLDIHGAFTSTSAGMMKRDHRRARKHAGYRPAALRERRSEESAKSSNAERWFDDSNANVRDGAGSMWTDSKPDPLNASQKGQFPTAC